jgi:hypothetical protein
VGLAGGAGRAPPRSPCWTAPRCNAGSEAEQRPSVSLLPLPQPPPKGGGQRRHSIGKTIAHSQTNRAKSASRERANRAEDDAAPAPVHRPWRGAPVHRILGMEPGSQAHRRRSPCTSRRAGERGAADGPGQLWQPEQQQQQQWHRDNGQAKAMLKLCVARWLVNRLLHPTRQESPTTPARGY